ncbi:MAG: hypothetical protein H0X37_13615 [Herpetosiphonaceae bacterium]|nr:hypothetical protein [Herpetosiphonaceae bacterium]
MNRFRLSPVVSLVGVLALGMIPNLATASVPVQSSGTTIEVQGAVHHDVSPPLRSMHAVSTASVGQPSVRPLLIPPRSTAKEQSDSVAQTSAGPSVGATIGLNFPGVGQGDYGFRDQYAPPDTNGAVGATQYVQWVNVDLAVFNKSNGALLLGPVAGNTIWTGFGGPCERNNDGDPIAQYDKAANRWVLTQFVVSGAPPFLQCVAVSQTSDATGSYNRYSFNQPGFNDYPKLSVWPDGYYITYNIFNNSGTAFIGGRVCAMDRSAMLAGTAATQQCQQLSSNYSGLLPSDLDGKTPPPGGSPNYVMDLDTNNSSLNLWKFHVDFATPANTTFTGPTNIPVPAFTPACDGTSRNTCIPQKGTTQQLESLGDRLMYRLAYRNFGDHEALVLNHSIQSGRSVGVRWYEVRSPSAPVVFQQGTYAPNGAHRWMGSIAMDKVGDIAVGYSVSSRLTYPSIRYTGRVPTDALGTLEGEATIKAGSGSQNGGLARWGDYSAMTVDPVDDCTFWYTNEYLKTTGSFNWSTEIASFKFPSCH